MWSLRQTSRAFLVFAILFGSLGLAIGSAYFYWYWPSAQGRLARQIAKQYGIVAMPLADVPDLPHIERIRAVSPGSNAYLFHSPGLTLNGVETNCYSRIDTVSQTIEYASRNEWEEATGEIIDALPHRIDFDPYKLPPSLKIAGRHLRHREVAPYSRNVAVFSADGRMHSATRGLLWPLGGRNAYADGQRYIEVQSWNGQTVITPPIAIPSPCSDEPNIWWTADERFIVCRYACYSNPRTPDSIVLVPTGLAKPSILRSGYDAKSAGYGIFQTDLWWEEWRGALEFQMRYESPKSAVMLFNMPVLRTNTPDGFLVYRYDPMERTLTSVESDRWLNATGVLYDSNTLFPKPDPSLREAHRKGGQERTPEDRALLKKEEEQNYRETMYLKRVSPIGAKIRGRSFTANEERVAVRSFDGDDSDFFYHEVFETNRGERIGDPIKIPKDVGWGPTWTPDGRYVLYRNQESRLLTIIHADRVLP